MEPVLEDDLVEFDDGTPATADQMARDVTEFLAWAADPHREIRHSIGSRVVVFLFLLTLMLIALKREVWAHLHEKKPKTATPAAADPAP
jgi:cytochrome c1